ncbi:MAG: bifunctional demethylmenaquinone methyltransferase/2-methoxy-6-polyprenyl-1,4-benzoquinol methylase UbiE [Flavobacteriales bacterium]|nr:bifunctional demethylmenaquinone methyltransferase/2-methoxy-6-polyprenyl-1,4-benzoquinol methylase UbiE [Flavobacteriales bacterium]
MTKPVTPYNDTEEKKAQVARMFDNIAHRYDFLNHLFSLGIDNLWRRKAVKILARHLAHSKTNTPQRLLDVATGTGDFAVTAARRIPTAHITGYDLSEGMLEVGRVKMTKLGLSERVQMQQGDAENMPFKDVSFDALTVAFGVRNFQDLQAGLREMHRVLAPGGLGLILEFSKPTAFPIKQVFHLYFRFIMPTIGRWVSRDSAAYSYLPESVAAFPEGEAMRDILCGKPAGIEFASCRIHRLTGGIASLYEVRKAGGPNA